MDVIRKVPEVVVSERMSHGEKVKDPKEKKKVPGWSIEEMKERPDMAVEENTDKIKRWRSLNESEIDYAGRIWLKEWKRKSWTSTKSKRVRRSKKYKIRKW